MSETECLTLRSGRQTGMSALITSCSTEWGAGLAGADRPKKRGASRLQRKTDISAYLHDPLWRESNGIYELLGPINESHKVTGFKSNIQNQLNFISNSETGIKINTRTITPKKLKHLGINLINDERPVH